MSWYCKEVPESRREQEDGSGSRTAQRVYRVWTDDETLTEPLHLRDRFGLTATNGEQLPSYAFPFVNNGTLLASHPEFTPLDPSCQLWEVTWNYKSLSAGERNPEEVGYVEWSATGSLEFRDKWRLGYAMPPSVYPDGSVPPSIELYTGGQPIDSAGEPLSAAHLTANITITEVIGTVPPWATIREAIGRRNSAVFGTYPIGTLLYKPPVVSKVGPGKYRLEHSLAYDQDYHLVMVAKRNGDGDVILGASVDANGEVVRSYAALPYWVQPFPLTYNFYAISPNFVGFA